jgi:MGT family glycosyltransferase
MNEYSGRALTGIKILMANVPADGHFNPLLPLAKYLQNQGAEVHWYTSNIFADKLKALQIRHWPFTKAKDINAQNVDEVFPERKNIKGKIARLNFDMIEGFAARSVEYYHDIRAIAQDFPFHVMICDSMFTAIPFVKERLNIPVIAIGVIPLGEASTDVYPYGLGMPPGTGIIDTVKRHFMHFVARNILLKKSIAAFDKILISSGLHGTKSDLVDTLIRRADAVMQIGVKEFEYRRSRIGKNVTFIGALRPLARQSNQPAWTNPKLKVYRKIVLVTQGTVEKDVTKLLVPALEAFKNTDILLIVTTGGVQTQELRRKYLYDNIIIEDYIPFKDVLPYCKVFITNGGYGGVLQSLSVGVPLVVAGVHEGKSEICARVGYFRAGINLKTETPTARQLDIAVEEVMNDMEYLTNANHIAGALSEYNAEIIITGVVAKLVRAKLKAPASPFHTQSNVAN